MTPKKEAERMIEMFTMTKGEWANENISPDLIREQVIDEVCFACQIILKELVFTDINTCAGKWAERRRKYWNEVIDEVVKISQQKL